MILLHQPRICLPIFQARNQFIRLNKVSQCTLAVIILHCLLFVALASSPREKVLSTRQERESRGSSHRESQVDSPRVQLDSVPVSWLVGSPDSVRWTCEANVLGSPSNRVPYLAPHVSTIACPTYLPPSSSLSLARPYVSLSVLLSSSSSSHHDFSSRELHFNRFVVQRTTVESRSKGIRHCRTK